MPFRFSFLVVAFVGLTALVQAQPQNATWYFGYGAGMKFDSSGNPTALTDGILTSRANATAISDSDGNLLLYSDGHRVYNKYHQQVLHGDSLYTSRVINASGYHGSMSGCGSVLLPAFDDTAACVMFTCNELHTLTSGFQSGFVYNKISISGDSVVLPKNQMLYTAPSDAEAVSERVLAIKHANGRDWWLLTHRLTSDAYWVWLYDPYGIHGPYEQHIGQYIDQSGYYGQMSCNSDGSKVLSACYGGYVNLFDFDRCTGLLSNYFELGFPPYPNLDLHNFYVEFSPNGQVGYTIGHGVVYQYDLTVPNPKATETLIYTNPYFDFNLPVDSQLQLGMARLGLNGKIYIALCPGNVDNQNPLTYSFNPRSKYLAVINNPDVLGSGCNFQLNGFYLGGKYSTYGLPNTAYYLGPIIGSGCDTIQPASLPTALFSASQTEICESGCVQFQNQSTGAASFQWFFPGGNPSSGTDSIPAVCYAQDGSYPVTLIVTNPDGSDTLVQNNFITVHPTPTNIIVHPSNDTLFTVGQFAQYQWFRDGVTATLSFDSFCVVTLSGTYTVIVTDEFGCTAQASYLISAVPEQPQPFPFAVSPNPADRRAVCTWTNALVDRIDVYDALGKTVASLKPEQTNRTEINLTGYPVGVYLLRAVTRTGTAAARRLVVER